MLLDAPPSDWYFHFKYIYSCFDGDRLSRLGFPFFIHFPRHIGASSSWYMGRHAVRYVGTGSH